jgi:hypothetical protein
MQRIVIHSWIVRIRYSDGEFVEKRKSRIKRRIG